MKARKKPPCCYLSVLGVSQQGICPLLYFICFVVLIELINLNARHCCGCSGVGEDVQWLVVCGAGSGPRLGSRVLLGALQQSRDPGESCECSNRLMASRSKSCKFVNHLIPDA